MAVTLITWSCGHFVQQKSPKYRTEAQFLAVVTEDYWTLREFADHDLANVATEHHIASPDTCPKCQQEPTTVALSTQRAMGDIAILRNLHDGCGACYVEHGAKYHRLDFSQKVPFTYDERCAAAHDQFWISRGPRFFDPFFFPMTNISLLCDEAQHLLETSDNSSYADVQAAFVLINKARSKIGHLINSLNEVKYAMHLMSEAPDRRKNKAMWHDMQSRESMICTTKLLAWFERMDDWQKDAVSAYVKLLPKKD